MPDFTIGMVYDILTLYVHNNIMYANIILSVDCRIIGKGSITIYTLKFKLQIYIIAVIIESIINNSRI